MNRNDFKELALIRLKETKILLESGNYEGAYYLCGYVVECGLKACIAKNTKRYEFPPDRKTVDAIYQHDLTKLTKAAGLERALDDEIKNEKFNQNWTTTKDWNEASRYEIKSEKEAQDLYSAVADKKDGVLKWIKQHW